MAHVDTDGMLINFAVNEQILNVKPKFKGGRWKDRLQARKNGRPGKIAQGTVHGKWPIEDHANIKGNTKNTSKDDDQTLDASQDITKRRRLNYEPKASLTKNSTSTTTTLGRPASTSASYKPEESGGVVSSLFTSNPTPKTVKGHEADSNHRAAPSNAPLADGTSTFTSLGLSTLLSSHILNKIELNAPTVIQKVAIPHLLKEDQDAFIQAETGSGKTLAYLLPIVQRIIDSSSPTRDQNDKKGEADRIQRDSGLFAIVLAPTRELSRQIATVLESLLRCAHWIVGGTVLGGERKKSEKARIRKGLNILVATPGRLADHLDNTQVLDVSQVRWLVLDEGIA